MAFDHHANNPLSAKFSTIRVKLVTLSVWEEYFGVASYSISRAFIRKMLSVISLLVPIRDSRTDASSSSDSLAKLRRSRSNRVPYTTGRDKQWALWRTGSLGRDAVMSLLNVLFQLVLLRLRRSFGLVSAKLHDRIFVPCHIGLRVSITWREREETTGFVCGACFHQHHTTSRAPPRQRRAFSSASRPETRTLSRAHVPGASWPAPARRDPTRRSGPYAL